MDLNIQDKQEFFYVYQNLFQLLSQIYLNEPTSDFVLELKRSEIAQTWPVIKSDDHLDKGKYLLNNFLVQFCPENQDDLIEDYFRLFVGFESMLAPPYESVYLSDDHIIFDPITIKIREQYQKYGLVIDTPNHQPDDHIGYQLAFLSHLCNKIKTDQNLLNSPFKDIKYFLNNHLLKWLHLFVERVNTQADLNYYKGIAILTLYSTFQFQKFLNKN